MSDKDTIPVVFESDALGDAYQMGFERFDGSEATDPESLSHFKESAMWTNNVAPKLRAMSGFQDSKGGTYQVRPEAVAVVPTGSEADSPIQADKIEPQYVHDAVIEAFDTGAYDGLVGNEYGESDDVTLL